MPAVLFQNRDACLDAYVTDIHRWTGDKPPDLVGVAAAKPTAQRFRP
jgi:hypothetical protein